MTCSRCSLTVNVTLAVMHTFHRILTLMDNFHHILMKLAVMVTFHRWQLVTFHCSRLVKLSLSLMVNFHRMYIYVAVRIMDILHHLSQRLVGQLPVTFHRRRLVQSRGCQHVILYAAVIGVNKQTQLMCTAGVNVGGQVS